MVFQMQAKETNPQNLVAGQEVPGPSAFSPTERGWWEGLCEGAFESENTRVQDFGGFFFLC